MRLLEYNCTHLLLTWLASLQPYSINRLALSVMSNRLECDAISPMSSPSLDPTFRLQLEGALSVDAHPFHAETTTTRSTATPTPCRDSLSSEVVNEIIRSSDWESLVAFASVSTSMRELAQKEARYRISWAINTITLNFAFSAIQLMEMLKECGGAVVGSCVLKAMAWGRSWICDYDNVRRITVMVVKGKGRRLMDLLLEYGMEEWRVIHQDLHGRDDGGIEMIWEAFVQQGVQVSVVHERG
jgi:hypothetical protein